MYTQKPLGDATETLGRFQLAPTVGQGMQTFECFGDSADAKEALSLMSCNGGDGLDRCAPPDPNDRVRPQQRKRSFTPGFLE